MNQKTLNIIFGIVIVVLIGAVVYFAVGKKSGPIIQQTLTSTPTPIQTKIPAPIPTTTPKNETDSRNIYANSRFGFELTFTDAWKGYRVFSSEGSQGVGAPTYLAFAMPTSDKTKCVMDITDEVCGYVAPFTITIIAKDRNVSTMDGKLGEDKTNAYYYSIYTHFNELPQDISKINFEIPKVISTFKFTK